LGGTNQRCPHYFTDANGDLVLNQSKESGKGGSQTYKQKKKERAKNYMEARGKRNAAMEMEFHSPPPEPSRRSSGGASSSAAPPPPPGPAPTGTPGAAPPLPTGPAPKGTPRPASSEA
jgi:hypothetical protein